MKKLLSCIGIILLVVLLIWVCLPKNRLIEIREGKEYIVFRRSARDVLSFLDSLDEYLEYMEAHGYQMIPDTDLVKGEMDFKKIGEDYVLEDIMPHVIQLWPIGGKKYMLINTNQVETSTVEELEAAEGHALNNLKEFSVSISELTAKGCNLTYSNQTGRTYDVGKAYYLYAFDSDKGWYRMQVTTNAAFQAIAYMIRPGETFEKYYSFEEFYGKLPAGEYCMIVSTIPERDDIQYPEEKDKNITEFISYFTVYFTME